MIRFIERSRQDASPFPDLPGWLSAILRARGADTPEKAALFLHPSLTQLHDPFLMHDMEKAVMLIRESIAEHRRIVIYGDYDVDGICAVSVMLETLRELGADAGWRIPDRRTEGYGLHEETVREIADSCQLLITVDCGMTNHTAVSLARSLGMTVIVTDHHEPDECPSPADAVLNPLLGEYPFRRLCGAGVALKVCQALQGMSGVEKRLDLAALATVADIVPLTDENRVIVKAGLERMTVQNPRPGIRALMRSAAVRVPMTADQIAFGLAPRLNAAGRLEHAGQGVELLTTSDEHAANSIADHLEENNRLRRDIEYATLQQAEEQVRSNTDFRDDRVIVVMGENWNPGVIGLVAGRLCEEYRFPVIALSSREGEAVGSCRSIPGVNIHAMLTLCKDLFIRFGGHEQAAGLTMRTELVPELRRRLSLAIRENCDDVCFLPMLEYDQSVTLSQTDLQMVEQLQLLEPTGYGNPSPLFLATGLQVQEMRKVGKDGTHLKTSFRQGDTWLDGIAFSQGAVADRGWENVDVLFKPDRNEFNGRVTVQMMIRAMNPALGASPLRPAEQLFGSFLKTLCSLAVQDAKNASVSAEKKDCDREKPASLQSDRSHRPDAKQSFPETEQITRGATVRLLREQRLGILVLTFDRELALALAAETGAETLSEVLTDNRGYSCILCCPDLSLLKDYWQQIILTDGDALPGLTKLVQDVCPRARLRMMKGTGTVTSLLRRINLDDEALRTVYRACRQDARVDRLPKMTGFSPEQVRTALCAFEETHLLQTDGNTLQLLPPVRCHMEDSPTVRYLRRINGGGGSL